MEMNEAEIAAKTTTEVAESLPENTSVQPSAPAEGEHIRLYQYFNISNPDPKTENMVKAVFEYAKKHSDGEYANILWAVRDLEHRLPAPRVGETRLSKLHGYVYLLGHKDQIQREIDSVEGV
jgi:hypothetical protein